MCHGVYPKHFTCIISFNPHKNTETATDLSFLQIRTQVSEVEYNLPGNAQLFNGEAGIQSVAWRKPCPSSPCSTAWWPNSEQERGGRVSESSGQSTRPGYMPPPEDSWGYLGGIFWEAPPESTGWKAEKFCLGTAVIMLPSLLLRHNVPRPAPPPLRSPNSTGALTIYN